VRVEGLSKSPHYNGQLGTIEREVDGGRLRVVLDQDGNVLSLKRENLVEVQQGQDGHVASNCASKNTATQQRSYDRSSGGDEQRMPVYNFCAPKGFQRQSTLERGMRNWFDNGEATHTGVCCADPEALASRHWYIYYAYLCIHQYIMYIYVYSPMSATA